MAKRKKKETAKKRSSARRARRQKPCWWAMPVSCLMILILAATAFLVIHEVGEYRRFRIMRSVVETDGFYGGIVVDNYDVSGVSLNEALRHWSEVIEPSYSQRTVTLTYGDQTWSIDAQTLGYESNYDEVLKSAWAQGRTGTLEQRYRAVNQIRTSAEYHGIQRREYDAEALRAWTDGIAESLTVPMKNATVESFDLDTHQFTFGPSSVGYSVDADELYRQASAALNAGGGTVAVNVVEQQPDTEGDALRGRFGMITQAKTSASNSSKDRLTNLRLACKALNGYCIQPGETFSYNQVVGPRTKSKGYKVATVYVSGELSEDIGGGVCQVSTTLWNAAMKANCSIVERHEHSRPVSYVDRGKDATVSYGSQDMKFKNTSNYPMYIVAYVTSDKRVYCEIYGELFQNGRYITIEAQTTETIKPGDPYYVYNPMLAAGQTVTVTEARNGYRASAYRVYHNADGSVINRELLCTSYYKAARATIEYG